MLRNSGKIAAALAVIGLVWAASPASANAIWTLTNLQLSDGTTVSGQFEVDYGYVRNWDITTNTGLFAGYEYTDNINAHQNAGLTLVDFTHFFPSYDGYLQLAFTTSLANYQNAAIDFSNSYECSGYASAGGNCTALRRDVVATTGPSFAAVPEPASLAIMGSALLGLGLMMSRRRKPQA